MWITMNRYFPFWIGTRPTYPGNPQVLVVQEAEEKSLPGLEDLVPKSEIFFWTDLLLQ